ncbi:beta-propeller domain-containing protein [Nocardioides sp.]|uniref:beta-propeller domain-containing protein n=1 Tax=Nocardioides sp. TaxID=35761 RepID=UPI0039E50D73
MTKLERLWDDLPAGPAPTQEILRAGRRAVADRRRVVLRPLLTAGGVAAIAGAFVAGTLVAGPGSPTASPGTSDAGTSDAGGSDAGGSDAGVPAGDASPVAFTTGLTAAGSCEELRQSYVDRSLGHVTAWGWDVGGSGSVPLASGSLDSGFAAVRPQAGAAGPAGPTTSRVTASDTGTNVQEAGVDEPDTVKTDGSLLVRVRRGDLVLYDVTGPEPAQLARLDLPRITDPELLLDGDTVVALGGDATGANHGNGPTGTRVLTIDIADPAAPSVTADVAYSSDLLAARQHGDVVRLTLSAGLPDLDFVQPAEETGEKTALETNRRKVEDSSVEDWLPTYDDGSGPQQLLDCDRVATPDDDLGVDTVSVVGFDVSAPARPSAIGLAAATTIAYESTDQLFLAASPSTIWLDCWGCAGSSQVTGTSYLFDFALDGLDATHVASGQVDGTIADRWSMDYADGTLRAALGPSTRTGNDNAVVTFRRDGDELVEAGRVDGLGKNEQIQSVRWFDDLAILVTYRQMDPLYAVSLTDPAHPTLLSELKIPGFSSYLHPLGPDRLVGVGQADWSRGQLGLFDVTDLSDVKQLDVLDYGKQSTTLAGQDPRAFTWLPAHRAVLTVVQRGNAGYLSIVTIAHGKLTNREVEVGHGIDVSEVRTLGLPDDRVVLVTGDDVSFLEL